MLYRSNTWPVKEQDVVRLDRNDVSMVKWMCKVRPENRVQGFPYWGDWGGGGGGTRGKNLLIPSPSAPTYKNYTPSKLPSPPNFYFPLFPPSKVNSPAPLNNNFQVTTQ